MQCRFLNPEHLQAAEPFFLVNVLIGTVLRDRVSLADQYPTGS